MKTIPIFFVALALAVGLSPRASGALLAYEGFNYTSGTTFLNSNGGFGFSGIWLTNNATVWSSMTNRPSSLSYTDSFGKVLLTTGGSAYLTAGVGSCQPLRILTNTFGTNGGTMWISFLGQRTGPATNTVAPLWQRVAAFQLHTNGSERIAVGRATYTSETGPSSSRWDTWSVYTAGSGANAQASTNYLTNVCLLVMRIDYVAGPDTAYLFVNPPDLTTAPDISTAAATNLTSDVPFDRFRLFAGNTSSAGLFAEIILDELRVGDNFTDVAPVVPSGGGEIPPTKWLASVALANSLSLTLTGGLGSNYIIQASTNVADINSWSAIGNLTLDGSGLGTFVDTNVIATNTLRFYRSKIP